MHCKIETKLKPLILEKLATSSCIITYKPETCSFTLKLNHCLIQNCLCYAHLYLPCLFSFEDFRKLKTLKHILLFKVVKNIILQKRSNHNNLTGIVSFSEVMFLYVGISIFVQQLQLQISCFDGGQRAKSTLHFLVRGTYNIWRKKYNCLTKVK